MTDSPFLRLTSVGRRFGAEWAVREVSVNWARGVHGLIGPNGAGKTTLLRIAASLLNPDTGSVATGPGGPEGVRLGYLPQEAERVASLRTAELVEYAGWLRTAPGEQPPEPLEALEEVGLAPKANARAKSLSGGEYRLACIATAITGNPEIVLFDEPTVGLDPDHRILFRRLVSRIGTSRCVVISSHLLDDIELICDDVAVLHDGRLRFHGTADELVVLGRGTTGSGDYTDMERGYRAALGE